MDRRKKRTSTSQYQMYIELMEKDTIFASGRVPRDVDVNYLHDKWKELSDKLNKCENGPKLTAEEWRKRLNDWKNTTRCKYRRGLSGEKDVSLTTLEMRALELFGKAPPGGNSATEHLSIHLKSEKEELDDEMEEQQQTSESFQKELQAAVEEAIGGEEDDENMVDEQDEEESALNDPLTNVANTTTGNASTTYRTIVVENALYTDDENNDEQVEFITQRPQKLSASSNNTSSSANAPHAVSLSAGVQTIVTTMPSSSSGTNVTKLINGDIPLKRLRSQNAEQIVYEVKKAPTNSTQPHTRSITIHNSSVAQQQQHHHHHQQQQQQQQQAPLHYRHEQLSHGITSQDARELTRQIKRLADVKAEKLRFEIARYKFNNPGFQYSINHL